ncbi:MAG: right-handed parallel beta-helix repeat-containing protein, partial [Actinomycetota bacterium]
PWRTAGDADVRYLADDEHVLAIDLSGRGHLRALGAVALSEHDDQIESVERLSDEEPVAWAWHDDALIIAPSAGRAGGERHRPDGPVVYRIGLRPGPERISLFEVASVDDVEPLPLGPLLASAVSGDVVQLGDGPYIGPAEIPPGVILRGLGRDRTVVRAARSATIRPNDPAITLGRNARVEHLRIEGDSSAGRPDHAAIVLALEAAFATVLACDVRGASLVTGDDAVIRATTLHSLAVKHADRTLVSRCSITGHAAAGGIRVQGGRDHEIESCQVVGADDALVLVDTVAGIVRGNRVTDARSAIVVASAEHTHVHGNHVVDSTRAVEIRGGRGAVVEGNAVMGGDSGCVVHAGATDATVRGNHWQRSRIGLLTWNADPHHADNVCVELGEPERALVQGP